VSLIPNFETIFGVFVARRKANLQTHVRKRKFSYCPYQNVF